MPCTLNHLIVAARDREESARFYREVMEAADAPSWGPFTNVLLDGEVLMQFANLSVDDYPDIQPQHHAFLVDDALFDRAVARLHDRGVEYWADHTRTRPGETNTDHGGRGVYFLDPAGHYLELITHPYL